eukprot:TRINITY_DN2579_c0_g2_i2.p1 TRINITY_DN2579_c0_g2~~TRINITY_DN2579_c0_g2_i2.p1  ORF type:complete len:471 (+),score=132.51 TRINITY_DN2579_c0_g2_i2:59-1414(+)
MAGEKERISKMSVKELKEFIERHNASHADLLEKSEFVARALEALAASASSQEGNEQSASQSSRSKLRKVTADSAFMQGRRPQQEDRHVKIPDLTKAAQALKMPIDHLEQPCSFFGVFDGHQGPLCAEFAAKGFHIRLLQKLSGNSVKAFWTEERLCTALREVCEELDVEFLSKHRTSPDGCTVVAALVTGDLLSIAWLGDSRIVLCRQTSQGGIMGVRLTEDHRPSVPAEADRVRKAGGSIVNLDGSKRVAHLGFEAKAREYRRAKANGTCTAAREPVALAVSRSLGDRDFKAVTGKALLIGKPSVRSLQMNNSARWIALLCDGITDVMRTEQVTTELDAVRNASDPAGNIRAACGALVQEAYKKGSGDNLTVVLAKFDWEGGPPPVVAAADGNSSSATKIKAISEAAAESKRRRVDAAAGKRISASQLEQIESSRAAATAEGDGSDTTFL